MKNNLQMEINKISFIFPKCFINRNNELILEPRNNIYFSLNDIKSVLDLKCKMIAWVSRPSCKGVSNTWQKKLRKWFNTYFERDFSITDIELIYTYLGNDIKRKLCEKFVKNNLDLEVIRDYKKSKAEKGK